MAKKDVAETKLQLGRPKGTLKMGLVGLPNVGKSSTFNLLCEQKVAAENFPFCTIEPNEARMYVPDDRFKWLCEHYKPKSEVSATLAVFDIAGLVRNAHKGEGLGNAFLSHIQAVDGIFHVVRAFEEAEVIHTDGEINPINDMETITDELRLKDCERMKKLVDENERICARGQDKTKKAELEMLKTFYKYIDTDKKWISQNDSWNQKEVDLLNDLQLLTAKPVVYLVNLSESDFARQKNKHLAPIKKWIDENIQGPIVPYSVAHEEQVAGNKQLELSSISKIIKSGYETLGLIHYFTCGPDEVKCWTVRKGTKAPQAAGVIHTDMEKGFICVEITKYADLVDKGSDAAVKAAGKLLTKGKEYVVEDGDICFFKFNPKGGKK